MFACRILMIGMLLGTGVGLPVWADNPPAPETDVAEWHGELWGSVQVTPETSVGPGDTVTLTATLHHGAPTVRWYGYVPEFGQGKTWIACGTSRVTIRDWDSALLGGPRLYDIVGYGPTAGSNIQVTVVDDVPLETLASIEWRALAGDPPGPQAEDPPPPPLFGNGDTFWVTLRARSSWPGWYDAQGQSRKLYADFAGCDPTAWSDSAYTHGAAALGRAKVTFNPEAFDIYATSADTQELTFQAYEEYTDRSLTNFPVFLTTGKGTFEPRGSGNETRPWPGGLVVYTDALGTGRATYRAAAGYDYYLSEAALFAKAWWEHWLENPRTYGQASARYQPLLNMTIEALDPSIPVGGWFPVNTHVQNVSPWDLTSVTVYYLDTFGGACVERTAGTMPVSLGNLAPGQSVPIGFIYRATGEGALTMTGYVGAADIHGETVDHHSAPVSSTVGSGLAVTIDPLPLSVLQNNEFTLVIRVRNGSSQTLANVHPDVLTQSVDGLGQATRVNGPDPVTVPLMNPNAEAVFTYVYRSAHWGAVKFGVVVEGDTNSGNRVACQMVYSSTVTIGYPYVMGLGAVPNKIRANGYAYSELRAYLLQGGIPAVGETVRFTSSHGGLSATPQGPGQAELTAITNEQGFALCYLISQAQPGLATIIAVHQHPAGTASGTCQVRMDEYCMRVETPESRFHTIPGRAAGSPESVTFPADEASGLPADLRQQPIATLFGETIIPVKLTLTGPDGANKLLQFSSDFQKNIGADRITFPETRVTDANGQVEILVGVKHLNTALNINVRAPGPLDAGWPGSIATSRIMDLQVKLADESNPEIKAKVEFPIVDNYIGLIQVYEGQIPVGPIWTQPDLIPPNVQHHFALGMATPTERYGFALPGILTNLMDSLGKPGFDTYTCGLYQMRTLNLFDRVRLNWDNGKLGWLLNGLHYGPVTISGGFHQAAVVWPATQAQWDHPSHIILDTWAWQDPKRSEYVLADWLLKFQGFSFPLLGSSTNPVVDNLYPNTGDGHNPYPDEPLSLIAKQDTKTRVSVLLHCPVDVTVIDAQGNRLGYIATGQDGAKTYECHIPDATIDVQSLDDSQHAFLLNLAPQPLTVEIRGHDDGTFSLLFGTSELAAISIFKDIPIRNGQLGVMKFDPELAGIPAIRFDDGAVALPDGKTTVTVPSVVNKTLERATYLLNYVGLNVGQLTESPTSDVSPGTVLASNPVAGSDVSAGHAVAITVAGVPALPAPTEPEDPDSPEDEPDVPNNPSTPTPVVEILDPPAGGCFGSAAIPLVIILAGFFFLVDGANLYPKRRR